MDEIYRSVPSNASFARCEENLGEQITMDDMARTAMFSKFHFSRIFRG